MPKGFVKNLKKTYSCFFLKKSMLSTFRPPPHTWKENMPCSGFDVTAKPKNRRCCNRSVTADDKNMVCCNNLPMIS